MLSCDSLLAILMPKSGWGQVQVRTVRYLQVETPWVTLMKRFGQLQCNTETMEVTLQENPPLLLHRRI